MRTRPRPGFGIASPSSAYATRNGDVPSSQSANAVPNGSLMCRTNSTGRLNEAGRPRSTSTIDIRNFSLLASRRTLPFAQLSTN